MIKKKVIMFDFDGVFVQTLEHAFSIHQKRNPAFTWEQYQNMSNGNFHEEYKKHTETVPHVASHDYGGLYNDKLQQLSIEEKMLELTKHFSQDCSIYIVSSSDSAHIKQFLEKERIIDCFVDILGVDRHVSKVVKIKSILEKENISPNQCVFITDTVGDIKEAHECGVESIAVSWGLHEQERLEKENPFSIVDTPEQLHQTIENFFVKI